METRFNPLCENKIMNKVVIRAFRTMVTEVFQSVFHMKIHQNNIYF